MLKYISNTQSLYNPLSNNTQNLDRGLIYYPHAAQDLLLKGKGWQSRGNVAGETIPAFGRTIGHVNFE